MNPYIEEEEREVMNVYIDSLEKENKLLKKDLKEYQAYIKKGVEEHYKDFMSDYDVLLEECNELNKNLKVLEILKKKMAIETDYYDSDAGCEEFEYIAYNGESLNIENKEEYDLIKEWLEDE